MPKKGVPQTGEILVLDFPRYYCSNGYQKTAQHQALLEWRCFG